MARRPLMSRDERGLWLALVDAVVHLPAARCRHLLGGLARSRGVWSSDCLLLMKGTTSWGQWWYWCCWCRREVNHEAGCCGCGSWTMELGELSGTGLLMSAAEQRNLFASGTYCCCLENHISYTIYLTLGKVKDIVQTYLPVSSFRETYYMSLHTFCSWYTLSDEYAWHKNGMVYAVSFVTSSWLWSCVRPS